MVLSASANRKAEKGGGKCCAVIGQDISKRLQWGLGPKGGKGVGPGNIWEKSIPGGGNGRGKGPGASVSLQFKDDEARVAGAEGMR